MRGGKSERGEKREGEEGGKRQEEEREGRELREERDKRQEGISTKLGGRHHDQERTELMRTGSHHLHTNQHSYKRYLQRRSFYRQFPLEMGSSVS